MLPSQPAWNHTFFFGLIQLLVLLLSLSVHECAHAWTADKLGDPTARFLGRVSLNPIVHSDLWGTVIFPLIGMQFGFMFGWAKPVPVNVGPVEESSAGSHACGGSGSHQQHDHGIADVWGADGR